MPFAESFASTLKSNKAIMLDKSKRFRKTMGGFEWSGKDQFNFPEATPEQLLEIRTKIIKEKRRLRIKTVLVFLAVLVVLGILTFYLL